MNNRLLRCLTALLLLLSGGSLRAETLQVAVAANFAAPMQEIAALFEKNTAATVLLSVGSTGKFVTQIRNGAPFDLLLAADQTSPASLRDQAVAGSQFTYAVGALVLWSASEGIVDAQTGLKAFFMCREDLISAKLASGRPQDLADVDALRKSKAQEPG